MGVQFADVIVDIRAQELDRPFAYRVPPRLCGRISPGTVVKVPFGKGSRIIQGYVIALRDSCALPPDRVKDIEDAVTEGLGEEDRLVALAAWMKSRYGSTMIQALRTVVPVRRKVRQKQDVWLKLKAGPDEAREHLERFRKKHQAARVRLLEALMTQEYVPERLARERLNITGATLQFFEQNGLMETASRVVYRNPVIDQETEQKRCELNDEQRAAADRIFARWESGGIGGTYLLHGITGSGKTEVYLELIERCIAMGRQAIVLIPEISLTYQTVMRFYRRFGERVSFVHSRLSPGERYDQYERALRGDLDVMIGPRSALFTPFSKLGIIVIDEEHEGAYHSESSPRFETREVALQRAKMENAALVLGSATPSLEAYHMAKTGQIELLELKKRPGASILPSVEIVDMREELRGGNRSILSMKLQAEMEKRLAAKEQMMLFLNRRGYAGFISCRSCGHVMKCPHCDVSLTLHTGGRLVCHYCGYSRPSLETCPECGSGLLRSFRAGTQQVESEILGLFPDAAILRMDADTTKKKDDYHQILSAFENHEADILVGTQMIVKGHDFPDVTLMGILAADMSLNVPDYRSAERTFQLITQAAGRAGRRDRPGSVIIQSYSPDHYSIQCASMQDYTSFYEREMEYRMLAGYPPAGALTAIHCTGPDEKYLETAVSYLAAFARRAAGRSNIEILGPADETIAKIQDVYRKVLYLKGDSAGTLIALREKIEAYVEMNRGFDPVGITYE